MTEKGKNTRLTRIVFCVASLLYLCGFLVAPPFWMLILLIWVVLLAGAVATVSRQAGWIVRKSTGAKPAFLYGMCLLLGAQVFLGLSGLFLIPCSPVVPLCSLLLLLGGSVSSIRLIGKLIVPGPGRAIRPLSGPALSMYLILGLNTLWGVELSEKSTPFSCGCGCRRSKTAIAKTNIRNLAVNLETYYIDHNIYPPPEDAMGNAKLFTDPQYSKGVVGYVPKALTTPVAYTAVLPEDPFNPGKKHLYSTNGLSCWVLVSVGPDGRMNYPINRYPTLGDNPTFGNCQWKRWMSQFGGPAIEYDSSNGTTSDGDVMRVGP